MTASGLSDVVWLEFWFFLVLFFLFTRFVLKMFFFQFVCTCFAKYRSSKKATSRCGHLDHTQCCRHDYGGTFEQL